MVRAVKRGISSTFARWPRPKPAAIQQAAPFFGKHGAAFLRQLQERAGLVGAEFDAIDTIDFRRSFAQCLDQATAIIKPLLPKSTF